MMKVGAATDEEEFDIGQDVEDDREEGESRE